MLVRSILRFICIEIGTRPAVMYLLMFHSVDQAIGGICDVGVTFNAVP